MFFKVFLNVSPGKAGHLISFSCVYNVCGKKDPTIFSNSGPTNFTIMIQTWHRGTQKDPREEDQNRSGLE